MSKSKQQLLDERYLRMARIWAENSYCEGWCVDCAGGCHYIRRV